MKKNFYSMLPLILILPAILCSCSSFPHEITEEDKLTKNEEHALIQNAREIVVSSKTIRIDQSERNMININAPAFGVDYSDYKTGRALITWELSPNKKLTVIAEGRLLKAEKNWEVKILRTEDVIIVDPKSPGYQDEKEKQLLKKTSISK